MKRRQFLKKSLMIAGAALVGENLSQSQSVANLAQKRWSAKVVPQIVPLKGTAPRCWYLQNRSPMQPAPLLRLRPGSIEPHGWVREQLLLQANGLNGRMQETSDYLNYDTCGWVHPDQVGWEEMPYWIRGFSDLGYVLRDPRIIADTSRWLNGIMDSQATDGWFGPTRLRTSLDGGPDFWPHMPLLNAFRAYHTFTPGEPRVVPFLVEYFQFMSKADPAQFGKSWGGFRMGDTLDTVFWTYNVTGEPFLLDLAKTIHAHSRDWVGGIASYHNVDFSQGFREPAQFGMLSGDPKMYQTSSDHWDQIYAQYGQFAGGGFAGDENVRQGYCDPRQGFETCGIAEMMQSCEMMLRMSGDAVWADRAEDLAINSMPAAFDPNQKGTHYITSANSIQLDDVPKDQGQFSNNWAMLSYQLGIHNYRCCPHNYGMAWPYFSEESWAATASGGLCAIFYHSNSVTAKVGAHGENVTIQQTTDYPFDEKISLTVMPASGRSIEFPIYLRIPGWADNSTVKVNGYDLAVKPAAGSFVAVEGIWSKGDKIELHLPQTTRIKTWMSNNRSVSVTHGPIAFSLAITETWKQTGGNTEWPHYEVTAGSPWNYGLVLDQDAQANSFDLTKKSGEIGANPFTHESAPFTLTARAKQIPNWKADDQNCITTLHPSPVLSDEPETKITLIPMGAARLRITSFPVIGSEPDAKEWGASE